MIRLGKKPTDPPPLFLAALKACVGRDPAFLRGERLATAGPFARLDDWSDLDDLLARAAPARVAA